MNDYKKIFDMLQNRSIIRNIKRGKVALREVPRWSSEKCFGNFFTNTSDISAVQAVSFIHGGTYGRRKNALEASLQIFLRRTVSVAGKIDS